ncbi:hypothetical protein ES288_D09G061500v1 [Gossypium darwinii]|uniref:Uncharacterized protein n=1 Tax=Gossypium darwinii TaxID=34276 RepID=A0A5D2B7F5_GOSDA|nr:hypothetical protein ES288_D09G061500v1 [Gossypium darwinii]
MHMTSKTKWQAHTSRMTSLTDIRISKWQTRWMQDMEDILVCITKYNGWPTPTPLSDMFERFPPIMRRRRPLSLHWTMSKYFTQIVHRRRAW